MGVHTLSSILTRLHAPVIVDVIVQKKNTHKFIAGALLFAVILTAGCSDEYSTKDFQVGPNGEPPKALKIVYAKEFTAERKNYVRALGEVHAFLIENNFIPVVYKPCFHDVLDIRVTADIQKHKKAFPCVAVQAENGAEYTQIYLRVSIIDVKFNQLDGNNRVIYAVEIFGKEKLSRVFEENVEPCLFKLYSGRTPRSSPPPNNSLPNQDEQQKIPASRPMRLAC
ncbi:hypothetical protein [Noviherbaspirillum aerium]|uniref:hypothetical protein n=1 Tax=Noviherbaspirillum aerium TaxID=2588497 RepID=UPI00124E73C7|nr:hypothetical protein [Noviherbaspirillum aerium]